MSTWSRECAPLGSRLFAGRCYVPARRFIRTRNHGVGKVDQQRHPEHDHEACQRRVQTRPGAGQCLCAVDFNGSPAEADERQDNGPGAQADENQTGNIADQLPASGHGAARERLTRNLQE